MPYTIQNSGSPLNFPDGAGGFVEVPHGQSTHETLPADVLATIRSNYIANEPGSAGFMTLTEHP